MIQDGADSRPAAGMLAVWLAVDLFLAGLGRSLAEIVVGRLGPSIGLPAIPETAQQAVWHDSFWLAFTYAAPMLALGWIRLIRRGNHVLGPGQVVLGAGIHAAALFWYARSMGGPVLAFLGVASSATAILGLTVRAVAHADAWFGEERVSRLVVPGIRERLSGFAAAVRRRPSASLLIAAGCALGGSVVALYAGNRGMSEALSDWAFFMFAAGVLIDLVRTVRTVKGVGGAQDE